MKDYEGLSHTKWNCKYHMVFIPKYRRKRIFGRLRQHLGEIFRELAKQKESRIVEGHLMADHAHMCSRIPPKLAPSSVVGFIKGKSAISIGRNFMGRKWNFTGESFWARGYFVSTDEIDLSPSDRLDELLPLRACRGPRPHVFNLDGDGPTPLLCIVPHRRELQRQCLLVVG